MTDDKLKIERRVATEVWPLEDLDLRADAKGLHFSGYAAVFNSDSQPLPFIERIQPVAFDKTLGEKRTKKMFLNHNTDIVLGSTRGSLHLTADKRGLLAEDDLPDNAWGRYVADAIERRDIDSMSFGFEVIRDLNPENGERWYPGDKRRELVEVRLHEVSIVTGFPAYEDTSASVRSLSDNLRDILGVLAQPSALLSPEQLALLMSSIDEHRAGPTAAEVRALWAKRFALEVTPEPHVGA